MDKMKMRTPDLTEENIKRLAALFPNVITEIKDEGGVTKKAIDFDLLKQVLSKDVVEGDDERYRLDWPGKKASLLKANTPLTKTLRPCREESVNFDTTENLYIEGDNFEALKILQESYLGKVKMIYIDPPYNTGNDFIYKDDFSQNKDDYEEVIGLEDEEGGKLFRNTDSNGRFHSNWLSMMYERLVVARDLLKDDGVIFISIDDNEVDNVKKICNEIFGEENFINIVTLKAKASAGASGGGEDKRLKKNTENIYIYSKNINILEMEAPLRRTKISDYIEEHKEKDIGFYYTRIVKDFGTRTFIKKINDISIYNHSNFTFSSINEVMKDENLSLDEAYKKYFNKIFMVTNAQTSILSKVNSVVNKKQNFVSYDYMPKSGKDKNKQVTKYIWNETLVVWFADSAVQTEDAVYKQDQIGTLWDDISWGRLDLEGDVPFKNGKKPLKLLERLLIVGSAKNDIILDFFSGSATTAHAVMQLNAEDSGNRKFIMVQLPEKTDENSEAYKAGYKTIADIGKERIRRAGKKIVEELKAKNQQLELGQEPVDASKLDIGFRVYKIDESNMKDVFYHPAKLDQKQLAFVESNIKEDRTPEDLLTQVILDLGLELSLPIETKKIGKNTVFIVQTNALVACFDNDIDFKIVDTIAGLKPFKVVFKDASFKDDKDRINVEERFKRLSPETKVTVI